MGVHGLWQLLHPSGRPVTLESLEGKVLAVDVSIWLHQSMKGMRDKDGNALPNAHLQGLFSRVCKLLFYRIKPVFVFDGGVPDLKKQTLAARREKKSDAMKERDEIGKKLLENLIKSQAVKQALGAGSSTSGSPVKVPGVSRKGDRDLFELAPLPEAQEVGLAMNSEAWVSDFKKQENWIKEGLSTLTKVDPDSVEFKSLPMEIQHEALVDLKEERKYHSLSRISKMPEDSDSFSSYQLKKLMKVSSLTTRIDEVRKDMANRTTMDLRYELGGDYYGGQTESRRIVSEDASHYILIKGLSKERQLEEAEKYDLDRRIKIEKDEEEPCTINIKKEKTLQNQKESSSPTKRQIQEKDDHVTHKRLKYDKTKKRGGAQSNSTKRALLSFAFSNSDEDDDEEELGDGNEKEPDEIEDSSSEDEGFIEVTFDPKQAAEEDELFPASIFATVTNITTSNSSYPTTVTNNNISKDSDMIESVVDVLSLPSSPDSENSPVQGDCYNEGSVSFRPVDTTSHDPEAAKKKKTNPIEKEVSEDIRSQRRWRMDQKRELTPSTPSGDQPRSRSPTSDSGKVKVDIAEKRKSVLSDIMAQLKKQKETLESLSVDEGDADGKEGNMVEEGKGLEVGGALSGGLAPEGGSSSDESDHGDKDKWGLGASGDKTSNVMEEEDFSFSGGFIREESSSGDEERENQVGYMRNDKRQGHGEIESGLSIRKSLSIQSNDGSDGDVAMLSSHKARHNDSEDEDLNLAIELSLQTARQEEKVKGGEKYDSEDGSGNIVSLSMENEDVVQGKLDNDDDEDDDDDDFETVETVRDGLGMENDFVTSAEQIAFADENDADCAVDAAVNDDFDDDELVAAVEVASLPPTHKSSGVAGSALASSEGRLQPEDVADPFMQFQQSNLLNIREELTMERSGLLSEQGRQDRFATSLTDQIILEAQELLNMFGIPYIVSPMEAEAQCAFLDTTGQTQGTITDDSDIWLFGGTRVYKNFFNQSKFVEFFSVDSIKSHFGLTREQLIKIALLCGSDYTVGIQGVGPVRALEIMGEFRGDGLEGLMAFRKWWDKSHKKPAMPGENKLRTRLKQLSLEGGFPSERVMEAYLCPAVDESRETFSWGQPDLDHLRHIAKIKFGWSKDRSDSILDPMMKQLLKRKTQGSIRSYFHSESYVPSSTATAHSDRIKKALSVMQSKKISNSNEDTNHDQNDRRLQAKNVKNTVVRKKRHGSGNDENGGEDEQDMAERVIKASQNKIMKNAKKDVGLSKKNNGGDSIGKQEDLNSVRGGDRGDRSGKVLRAKGKVEEKKKVGKGKAVKQAGRKELEGIVGNSGSGDSMKDGLTGVVIKTEPGVKEGLPGVVIKTEPGFDYDGFMKDMRDKVAKASSLLETGKDGTGKRGGGIGGRGRGRGGSKARGVRRTPGVPSLEKRGVRSRSQRGKSSSNHSTVRNRGVICLSESSSSSSGSGDNDSGDNDSGGKIDFVDIENKIRQHSKNLNGTNSNNAVKSSRPLSSSKSDVITEDLLIQGKKDAAHESSVPKLNLPVKPSVIDQVVRLKVHNKQVDSSISQVDGKRKSKELLVRNEAKRMSPLSKNGETEGKKLKKNDVVKGDGLVKSKTVVEVGLEKKKDNSENNSDKGAELNKGMEGVESKDNKVVGQVAGKNPDVSIINAMTLKATMSYLNQRSLGEKHLLNALGGKRPTNAVERRLEEEERRRKRGNVDYIRGSNGRERDGAIPQKEVKKSKSDSKYEKQKDLRPKLSFEDMLGGTEALLPGKASKLKSTSRQEKSNKSGIEKSSTDRKTAKKKEDDNRGGNGDKLKPKEDGYKSESKVVGGRSDDSRPKGRKARMKSCSDESGSEEISTKGGCPVKGNETRRSKSINSNTLNDVPVKSREVEVGEERGLDKFGLQVSHLWDKQSVKGHGVLPPQGRSKKSQMFDMPLDGSGMAPSKIESRKKQCADYDAEVPSGGGFVDAGGGGYDWVGGSGLSVVGNGRAISRGRAIAGKGKGIGKNRNGRQAQPEQSRDGDFVTGDSLHVRSLPEIDSVRGGTCSASTGQDQVSSVLASSGVTDAEIMEFGCMTTDDLGSDFDDDDF